MPTSLAGGTNTKARTLSHYYLEQAMLLFTQTVQSYG